MLDRRFSMISFFFLKIESTVCRHRLKFVILSWYCLDVTASPLSPLLQLLLRRCFSAVIGVFLCLCCLKCWNACSFCIEGLNIHYIDRLRVSIPYVYRVPCDKLYLFDDCSACVIFYFYPEFRLVKMYFVFITLFLSIKAELI